MTPGMKAYRDTQRQLAETSSDPTQRKKRQALRTRLREITMRLTPFELRDLSDAPPIRGHCCGG